METLFRVGSARETSHPFSITKQSKSPVQGLSDVISGPLNGSFNGDKRKAEVKTQELIIIVS